MEQARQILDGYMKAAIDEKRHLGLAFGFLDRGAVHFWNHGWADQQRQRPVTESDFFEVGSVGKVFTAVLFGKLIADGLCADSDPIQKFIPEIPSRFALSISQLLTHTSGLPREPENFVSIALENSFIRYGESEFMSALSCASIASEQGRFEYCSFGYLMLGLAAKRIVGCESFSQLLLDTVIRPLGLHDLKFKLDESDLSRFCHGHSAEFESISYLDLGDVYNPAGGLKATVSDMCKFIGQVLDPESAPESMRESLMMTQRLYSNGTQEAVAFGWHTAVKNGLRTYYHPGHLAGSKSSMLFCPDLQRGIAYCSNTLSHVRTIWDILMCSA